MDFAGARRDRAEVFFRAAGFGLRAGGEPRFFFDARFASLMSSGLTEPFPVDKPKRKPAVALSTLTSGLLAESFARQGFASGELVTRWPEIAGADICEHAEPLKIQWRRPAEGEPQEPGTLVLRVEGPAAIEIQHLAGVILERVNRFFGWQAVDRLALRQAPIKRAKPRRSRAIDPEQTARIAQTLPAIEDEDLKQALARLGAAIKAS